MSSLSFVTVDVFTQTRFAGNPLAIVLIPNSRIVADEQMQTIAREFNLSDTVFLHEGSTDAETEYTADQLYGLQPVLRHSPPKALDIVSPVKGMNFICTELSSIHDLGKVKIMGSTAMAKLDQGWDTGFLGPYFYVITAHEGRTFEVRTRAIEGNIEDPATGSAACALTALLTMKYRLRSARFRITQGVEMGRQSEIRITVTQTEDLDVVESIELSGSSVQVMEGTLRLE